MSFLLLYFSCVFHVVLICLLYAHNYKAHLCKSTQQYNFSGSQDQEYLMNS